MGTAIHHIKEEIKESTHKSLTQRENEGESCIKEEKYTKSKLPKPLFNSLENTNAHEIQKGVLLTGSNSVFKDHYESNESEGTSNKYTYREVKMDFSSSNRTTSRERHKESLVNLDNFKKEIEEIINKTIHEKFSEKVRILNIYKLIVQGNNR